MKTVLVLSWNLQTEGTFFFHFSWNAVVLDGHDVEALCRAFHDANVAEGKPTCIVAKTYKGRGING